MNSFNNFNHLEWHSDYRFIILTCFQHIFVILLIIPVHFDLIFCFMYCLKLFEYIKNAF